jgi:hypothetical protein
LSQKTIQAELRRRRPFAVVAFAIWAVEAAVAILGGSFPLLAGLVLVLAPGLALVPLLPEPARRSALVALAAAPALGIAAASVALTSVAATGIPLTGFSVRVVLLAVIVAGFAMAREGDPPLARPDGERLLRVGALGAAVVAGIVLQARVIGESPVPGNDWAKYLLYADEIRNHGSLLIDNPYWLLGVPFREDPGAPSLYGSFLLLTGGGAAVLMHGIWVFAVAGILSAYALARSLWGAVAGTAAAAFWAIVPISQDILGWHGLANAGALVLMPLILLFAAELLRAGLARREAVGLGLLLVALAGMHRLSFAIGVATLGLCVLVGLLSAERRRRVLEGIAWAAGATVVLGGLVAYHLIDRSRTFGGTQGFEAYESQKVDLELVARDLTYAFTGAAILAVLATIWFVRRDVRLVPLLALLTVIGVLAYSYVVEFPMAYVRTVYYLPLILAPLAGYALSRLPWRRAGPLIGVALAIAVFIPSWNQAENVKSFYTFANDTSLKGLDLLEGRLEEDEVVVTDRCWSFLGTWLLHTRTLAALEPADIQPKAEVPLAEQAREVLGGTQEGSELARELGIRYLIVNPECTDDAGRPIGTPTIGEPVFVSRRLVILELDA